MKSYLMEKLRDIGSIFGDTYQSQNSRVYHILQKRAAERSVDFVEKFIGSTLFFKTRDQIRDYAVDLIPDTGLLLEFGVYNGRSINYFSKQLDKKNDKRNIYGFDSFQGLDEDWYGVKERKHKSWSMFGQTPSNLHSRARLSVGLIQVTLKPFLENQNSKIAFIHIDTDTYTPAKIVLEECKDYMPNGCVVLFDELIGYPNWENHEYKALKEVLKDEEYSFKAFADNQAIIEINKV